MTTMTQAPASTWFISRDRCPACDSPDSTTLLRRDFLDPELLEYLEWFYADQGPGIDLEYLEGAEYRLEDCNSCGLVYQQQVAGDALMLRLYETWIDADLAYQRHLAKKRSPEFFGGYARDLVRLHNFLGARPYQLTVLDYGMGWGNWCQVAAGLGCRVYGVELSPARIDHAERHGISVLSHDQVPDHRFDFIHTEQVFEHITAPRAVLAELSESLRPGGILQLSVPNGTDIRSRLKTLDWHAPKGAADCINAVAPLEHINCFHHDALVSMAEACGLMPIRTLASGKRTSRADRLLGPVRRIRDFITGRWRRSTFLCFQAPGRWTAS